MPLSSRSVAAISRSRPSTGVRKEQAAVFLPSVTRIAPLAPARAQLEPESLTSWLRWASVSMPLR